MWELCITSSSDDAHPDVEASTATAWKDIIVSYLEWMLISVPQEATDKWQEAVC